MVTYRNNLSVCFPRLLVPTINLTSCMLVCLDSVHTLEIIVRILYTCHVTNVYALVLYDNVVCRELRVKKFVSERHVFGSIYIHEQFS